MQYIQVGNTLQLAIDGEDVYYRFNMGAQGYLGLYSKEQVDALIAGIQEGISLDFFNNNTGTSTQLQINDIINNIPQKAPLYVSIPAGSSRPFTVDMTLPQYEDVNPDFEPQIVLFTNGNYGSATQSKNVDDVEVDKVWTDSTRTALSQLNIWGYPQDADPTKTQFDIALIIYDGSPVGNINEVQMIDQAFAISGIYNGADTYTITPPAVPNGNSGPDGGYSFPIGKLTAPTNKVSLKLGKSSGVNITQIEVRIFAGTAAGVLLAKKRINISPLSTDTSFSPDVTFDSTINVLDQNLWMQVLCDGSFTIQRLNPAVKFTSANGYTQMMATATVNLDGTTFSIAGGFVDIYVKLNSVYPAIVAKPQLVDIITDGAAAVTDRFADEETINLPILGNSYLALNNTFVASANWRSVDFTPVSAGDGIIYSGITSSAANGVVVANADKSQYLTLVGNSNSLATQNLVVPDGYSFIAMCATVASSNTYIFQIKKYIIKAENLPAIANNDYDSIKKTVPYGWNAVGHSIWYQDGVNFTTGPDAGQLAVGIQSWVRQHVTFTDYNNYGYSGNSLTWTDPTDTTSILFHANTWVDNHLWSYDSITNDFKLNRPIGVNTDFLNRTGATTYYGALRELHEIMKGFDPLYICICGTPLQRNNSSYTSWSANTIGKTMTDYINALLWVRNYLSWRLVDQFNDSGFTLDNVNPANTPTITIDGLHPTNLGYTRYYGIWLSEFYKLSY